VAAFCPTCKGATDLLERWDLGDDEAVHEAHRRRHPNAVTATYPSGEVHRSFFVAPAETLGLLVSGGRPGFRNLLHNFDARALRRTYGVKASHFGRVGLGFADFLDAKSSRMHALRELAELDCTADDLRHMCYVPETEEEEAFLATELRLFPDEIESLKRAGER